MEESNRQPIESVFCAYDFSENSEIAVEQAQRFVRRHGAKLILGHVVEPVRASLYPSLMISQNDLEIVEIAREQLEKFASSLGASGFEIETCVEEGPPEQQLLSMIERSKANLVVIGTRGLTGLKRLAMGSVAEYIVRRAKCPVLSVHPRDHVLRGPLERVLLPTDLSANAMGAVNDFIQLFGEWERPRVLLAYVDRTPPYLEPFRHDALRTMNEPDVVRAEIEARMRPLAERLRAADFEVEVLVLDGDPVSALTQAAEDCAVNLILMSKRGRGPALSSLTGRTSQRVVQLAPCPVLTVSPPLTQES